MEHEHASSAVAIPHGADCRVILVTGATGFLGRRVVGQLLSHGLHHPTTATKVVGEVSGEDGGNTMPVTVIAVGRRVSVGQQLEALGATFYAVDLRDTEAVQRLVLHQLPATVHAVIHAAAKCDVWGAWRDFHGCNVLATTGLLQAFKFSGKRVGTWVHVSTPSLYQTVWPQDRIGVGETAVDGTRVPWLTLTAYIRSKWMAEAEVHAHPEAYDRLVILRPRAIFGPGDETILPRVMERLRDGSWPLLRDGRVWTDLTYVDNVVDAILCSLTSPNASGTFNITNGEPIQLRSLLQLLCTESNLPFPKRHVPFWLAWCLGWTLETVWWARGQIASPPPLMRYMVSIFGCDMTLDIKRARQVLGYEPRVSLTEGLRRTMQSLHEH